MFFFTYKTTNLVNGKYYFGRHSTETLEDGYLGSGKLLRLALDKYGKDNFRREVIEFYSNAEELTNAERELVNENLLSDVMCYNLDVGGKGGERHTDGAKKKIGDWRRGIPRSEETRRKLRDANLGKRASLETRKKMSLKYGERVHPMLGKKHSDETKQRMSLKRRGKEKSEKTKRKMSESLKKYFQMKKGDNVSN